MPNRNLTGPEQYRYTYQGQEKDPETGKEAFQLRLWDGRIGRWLTTDPYGQYNSPYVGMGNDPINGIDPDGGYWFKWMADVANFFSGGNGTVVGVDGGIGNGKFAIQTITKGGEDGMLFTMSRDYGSDGLGHGIAFSDGFSNAFGSNQMLGVGRRDFGAVHQGTFLIGQLAGDITTTVQGAFQTIEGAAMTGEGGVLAIPSGGTSLVLSTAGVATTAHGLSVAATSGVNTANSIENLTNYFSKKKHNGGSGNNFKKINEKDGNKFAKKAGYKNAHEFKDEWKPAGNGAEWNMTINSKNGQLGLIHRKTNVEVYTNVFIK